MIKNVNGSSKSQWGIADASCGRVSIDIIDRYFVCCLLARLTNRTTSLLGNCKTVGRYHGFFHDDIFTDSIRMVCTWIHLIFHVPNGYATFSSLVAGRCFSLSPGLFMMAEDAAVVLLDTIFPTIGFEFACETMDRKHTDTDLLV